MRFSTTITLKNGSDLYNYRYYDRCSVSNSSAELTPSADFSILTTDKSLVDRFPVISTEIEIWQGRPGAQLKTFSGFLQTPPKSREGSLIILEYHAAGWYEKTRRIIVNESYDNKTIDFIVRDLHSKYLFDFGKKIEYSDRVIEKFRLSFDSLYDAFERLAELVGYISYIDNNKCYNFHSETFVINPNTLTEQPFTYNRGSAKFEPSTDDLVNRIYVRGGMQASEQTTTQTWSMDGINKVYNFGEEVSGPYRFYYNDTPIGSGIKGIENFSDTIKILVDEKGSFETFETYLNGTIKAEYYYKFPIIDLVEDFESQKQFGVISQSLMVDSSDRDFVLSKANLQLDKYSFPILKGSIEPYEPLYQAGEVVLINIPSLKINQYMKVCGVNYDSSPNNISCRLDLEYNPGIQTKIKALEKRIRQLEKGATSESDEKVNKLYSLSDTIQSPVISDNTENYTHALEACSSSLFAGGWYI